MALKYKTISERLKIQDENISKILNHFERQGSCKELADNTYHSIPNSQFTFMYDKLHIEFDKDTDEADIWTTEISEHDIGIDDRVLIMPTKILADNIVGIYGSLKHII